MEPEGSSPYAEELDKKIRECLQERSQHADMWQSM
jgi:hypothetical protein